MEWVHARWHQVVNAGSDAWLAWAVWALLALGVIALISIGQHNRRNRRLASEETRPHVGMFMEPHAADWHVIELVVRNFGKTPAYDISFTFPQPPTVAEYENATDGYADVVELQLPKLLPTLAPGQEWRTVWDSALDRTELGEGIESRFPGTVTFYDRVDAARVEVLAARPASVADQGGAGLGVAATGPAHRVDDEPRPGQAGKAEARAVAQPADLLSLRLQGNSRRGVPQ
jgi:hypothetical protein